ALTASNAGTAASSGTVTVTDTLPGGLTATAIGRSEERRVGKERRCSRRDAHAAEESYAAITVTVDGAISAPARVTNSATVSGGGETNTANDTATDPTVISPAGAPDQTITKTHEGNFTQGQTGASYALTASNIGTAASSGTVTVTDTLPGGLTATAIG